MSTQNAGRLPRNVSRAVVIKSENVFGLNEHEGGIPSMAEIAIEQETASKAA